MEPNPVAAGILIEKAEQNANGDEEFLKRALTNILAKFLNFDNERIPDQPIQRWPGENWRRTQNP